MPRPLFRNKMINPISQPIIINDDLKQKMIKIYVNPFYTITQFIEYIIPILSKHFQIDEQVIEIIVTKKNNIDHILHSKFRSEEKLYNIWGEKLQLVELTIKRNY